MRTAAIYSFWYSNWKTNMRIIAFVFYAGQNSQLVHALNIGALQLTSYDRIKIITTIKKMSAIKNTTFYNGRLLYKIFKTYLWPQVKKCYRTYNKLYISRVTLVNYGLNNPSEFSIQELNGFDKTQYNLAKRDMVVKIMNLYTQNGAKLSDYRNIFAKPDTLKNRIEQENKEINMVPSDQTGSLDKPNTIIKGQ